MSVAFAYLVLNEDPVDVADTRVFGTPKIDDKHRIVIVETTKTCIACFIIIVPFVVALFSLPPISRLEMRFLVCLVLYSITVTVKCERISAVSLSSTT